MPPVQLLLLWFGIGARGGVTADDSMKPLPKMYQLKLVWCLVGFYRGFYLGASVTWVKAKASAFL